jgi:hypothetical protein
MAASVQNRSPQCNKKAGSWLDAGPVDGGQSGRTAPEHFSRHLATQVIEGRQDFHAEMFGEVEIGKPSEKCGRTFVHCSARNFP